MTMMISWTLGVPEAGLTPLLLQEARGRDTPWTLQGSGLSDGTSGQRCLRF